jgi:hypothetical protein
MMDAPPRSLRWLAALVVLSVCIAVALVFEAGALRFEAILVGGPYAGMFGTAEADIRVTAEQRAENHADAEAIRARAGLFERGARGLMVLAVMGTVVAGWRTRRDVRRWHWPSLLGFPLVIVALFATDGVGTCQAGMLGFVAADLVILCAALFDLRRKRAGTPGRVVAWATGLIALASAIFVIYGASLSGGVIWRLAKGLPPC